MTAAPTSVAFDGPARRSAPVTRPSWRSLLPWAAGPVWIIAACVTWRWPDADDFPDTTLLAGLFLAGGLVLLLAAALHRLSARAPWAIALGVGLAAWEIAQAKLLWLPRPFFGTPQDLLDVFVTDWRKLGDSLLHSLALLVVGYTIGSLVGIAVGVGLGRSVRFRYWVQPVIRLIGPLPPVALLPLAFVLIPSSRVASEALMSLAAGFPVAILTWSGIAAVDPAYYDVARTMGARGRFLVLRVALPAATPQIFVGLFMGLGASFAMLVVAEMLGVKSGLGFYMQWAQGWAAYPNMYAALLVMSVMCTGLMTLLFRVRDHVLKWQKDGLKW
ncbi:nitrate/sulfonate/bicarbonate ABC transporter permease [Ameyamaea chiangmaiensis NBRC 103196]|uniref:ABC transporter permease subunit n=1 Tax=Ameyamaea chiangmaiensis TaxID=442969 RepID=A0A850PE29_9PROT|nr:ABC transporter permease subunit [Ameyamaea chiangmaiensis]MBS4076361.1 ABC transporter permease subunit [Ameyamaea chiangmaiensis]NVN40516.1 ABC transporter permease subunit [Ameyamaea chiangmaiensis]GBQ63550.1 nitrate/sulfonate/bicarbonate ABC transporter permease [Ameyamaea chiangmaiensis NBRC 103196]